MRRAQAAAVSFLLTLPAGLLLSIEAAEVDNGQKPKSSREKVWNKEVDGRIRSVIRQADSGRTSKNLFALAKDPLPYRELNFTLPGHQKNTLCEADDYIAARLASRG